MVNENKIAIITGANSGIGYETALNLTHRGITVVLACRDKERAHQARNAIVAATKSVNVFDEELNLGDLSSVRDFVKRFKDKYNRLDLLINNAGIMMCPYGKTKDGFENQLGVNHLGHFLLTNLLLDILKQSAPSRIINVSSLSYKRGVMKWDDLMSEKSYDPMGAYRQSKLANVLFTNELSKRLNGTNVTAVSLHPGVVKTGITRSYFGFAGCLTKCLLPCIGCLMLSPEQGAQTTIHCAVSDDIPTHAGCYFSDSKVEQLLPHASNPDDARRLWDVSAKLVKLDE